MTSPVRPVALTYALSHADILYPRPLLARRADTRPRHTTLGEPS